MIWLLPNRLLAYALRTLQPDLDVCFLIWQADFAALAGLGLRMIGAASRKQGGPVVRCQERKARSKQKAGPRVNVNYEVKAGHKVLRSRT